MNPYLTELHETTDATETPNGTQWQNQPSDTDPSTSTRRELVTKYAWAIPNNAILSSLVDASPIVEIGAGNGYWASCIESNGGDVTPFDVSPPENTWTTVHEAPHTVVTDYADHTLFLCWPSFNCDWPAETVHMYDGDQLVYIGDGRGGVTGSHAMHRAIDETFGIADHVINIPQWSGTSDKAYVFTR